MPAETTHADLARSVAGREWYHTLELAPGVTTPGWFDTRPVVDRLPIPGTLAGKRCLDIGTFDGFWGFEMERRGAEEVVAIDVLDSNLWDWPAGSTPEAIAALDRRKDGGSGFEIAQQALESSVKRLELSVYDLDPDVHGRFDFVYLGSQLLHLRDPVGALNRVRAVCSGELLVVDAYYPSLTLRGLGRPVADLDGNGRPWWWRLSLSALVRAIEASGFELVRKPIRFLMPAGPGHPRPGLRKSVRSLRHSDGRESVRRSLLGDPHAAVLARRR